MDRKWTERGVEREGGKEEAKLKSAGKARARARSRARLTKKQNNGKEIENEEQYQSSPTAHVAMHGAREKGVADRVVGGALDEQPRWGHTANAKAS